MYLHPSTITGVIDRLEKKRYVARIRDQVDRRVIYVQLTAEGKRLAKRAPNPAQGKMNLRAEKFEKARAEILFYDSSPKIGQDHGSSKCKGHFLFRSRISARLQSRP